MLCSARPACHSLDQEESAKRQEKLEPRAQSPAPLQSELIHHPGTSGLLTRVHCLHTDRRVTADGEPKPILATGDCNLERNNEVMPFNKQQQLPLMHSAFTGRVCAAGGERQKGCMHTRTLHMLTEPQEREVGSLPLSPSAHPATVPTAILFGLHNKKSPPGRPSESPGVGSAGSHGWGALCSLLEQ